MDEAQKDKFAGLRLTVTVLVFSLLTSLPGELFPMFTLVTMSPGILNYLWSRRMGLFWELPFRLLWPSISSTGGTSTLYWTRSDFHVTFTFFSVFPLSTMSSLHALILRGIRMCILSQDFGGYKFTCVVFSSRWAPTVFTEPLCVFRAGQEVVFQCLGESLLDNAFMGYNACIFAYGQTGLFLWFLALRWSVFLLVFS